MYCGKCRRNGKQTPLTAVQKVKSLTNKRITFCPVCCPQLNHRYLIEQKGQWKIVRDTGRY